MSTYDEGMDDADASRTLDQVLNVERSDADLYVERVGPLVAPLLYYLHGGPGYNSHSFRDLMGDDLEDYQVLYADQRGGGRSYGSGSSDLGVLASDVAAVLSALEAPPAVLLAHGYGAAVAVRTALDHPALVRGLVLVNPWLSMPLLAGDLNRAAQRLAGQEIGAGAEPEGYEDEPERLVDDAFALANPKTVFDALQFPVPTSRLRLEHSDTDALFGPPEEDEPVGVWRLDVLPELERLKAPTVILAGRLDGTAFPTQVEAALARLPDALVSIVDTGHYPWLDDPESFVPLLHEALAHVVGTAEGT